MREPYAYTPGRRPPGVQNGKHDVEMPSKDLYRLASISSHDSGSGLDGVKRSSFKRRMIEKSNALKNFGRSLGCRFSPTTDGFEPKGEARVSLPPWMNQILDPRTRAYALWRRVFIVTCLVAIFLDPLFFYVPVVHLSDLCFDVDLNLAITVTVLRTVIDLVYVIHMLLQFRTGFIAPSSRVFGIGELVEDTNEIARRYMRLEFWLDLLVILPAPQVVMWVFLPFLRTSKVTSTKNAVLLLVIFHYVPRLFRMFLTVKNSEMVTTQETGIFMETVWAGAAYNLLLYMLASHVFGACWYLLTVERQDTCWRAFCDKEILFDGIACNKRFFNCRSQWDAELKGVREEWLNKTSIRSKCVASSSEPTSTPFNFGLYSLAMENNITSGLNFVDKYFYCLWFGLNSLSSLGQGFKVSTYIWEVFFAIIIFISGLLLFALLIGNVQKYLSSVGTRVDEMRVKRRDTEEWMNHRQLPAELRSRVRRYDMYKWVETQGVDEQALLQNLPHDLRRDIKRHLCLDLVKRVPLFNQMDERLLDAICEILQPVLHTENSYLVQEGDPVVEMVFIIRGHLESITTNGGRTGFFNLNRLGPGGFCGEELLPWALESQPDKTLPSSTRTVKAVTEVEAFSLSSRDLKFVAGQFRKLHSKKLQHTFRYHSHQWRTWAANFIQATWRRHRQRRMKMDLTHDHQMQTLSEEQQLRAYDEAFMEAYEGMQVATMSRIIASSNLSKPLEPDFFRDDN